MLFATLASSGCNRLLACTGSGTTRSKAAGDAPAASRKVRSSMRHFPSANRASNRDRETQVQRSICRWPGHRARSSSVSRPGGLAGPRRHPNEPEAKVIPSPALRRVNERGRPASLATCQPASSPESMVIPRIGILAPFRDVAMHVVQTQGIGLIGAHRGPGH